MADLFYATLGTTAEAASDDMKGFVKHAELVMHPDISYEDLMKIYTEWAPIYDKGIATWGLEVINKTILDVVDKYSGDDRNRHILHLCAGTGLYGKMLADGGYRNLDALDGNKGMLAEAEKKGVYGKLIVAQLGKDKLPFEDNSYDLLLMPGCLCDGHVGPSSFRCFRELIRVAKPGSHFIGCIGEVCVSPAYRQAIEAAINELVDEGLWSWTINDILPKVAPRKADQQQFWVLKIN